MLPYTFGFATFAAQPEYLGTLAMISDVEAIDFGRKIVADMLVGDTLNIGYAITIRAGTRNVCQLAVDKKAETITPRRQ